MLQQWPLYPPASSITTSFCIVWNNELWSASTSEYSTSEIDWFSCFNSTDNERAGGREQVGEDGDWASEQKEKKKKYF